MEEQAVEIGFDLVIVGLCLVGLRDTIDVLGVLGVCGHVVLHALCPLLFGSPLNKPYCIKNLSNVK